MIRFDWDRGKERSNVRKHGVSFEEASEAFFDEYGIFVDDPDHSDEEDRFILLGASHRLRVLVVCHCYREEAEEGDVVRLISARKANRREANLYNRRRRS